MLWVVKEFLKYVKNSWYHEVILYNIISPISYHLLPTMFLIFHKDFFLCYTLHHCPGRTEYCLGCTPVFAGMSVGDMRLPG